MAGPRDGNCRRVAVTGTSWRSSVDDHAHHDRCRTGDPGAEPEGDSADGSLTELAALEAARTEKRHLLDRAAASARADLTGPSRLPAGCGADDLPVLLQRYYWSEPAAEVLGHEPAELAELALGHLKLAEVRPPGSATVDVHLLPDGRSVIRLVTDDMPFLVDSVTAEVVRQGVTLAHVVHPVVVVRRDLRGRIKAFCDSAQAAGCGVRRARGVLDGRGRRRHPGRGVRRRPGQRPAHRPGRRPCGRRGRRTAAEPGAGAGGPAGGAARLRGRHRPRRRPRRGGRAAPLARRRQLRLPRRARGRPRSAPREARRPARARHRARRPAQRHRHERVAVRHARGHPLPRQAPGRRHQGRRPLHRAPAGVAGPDRDHAPRGRRRSGAPAALRRAVPVGGVHERRPRRAAGPAPGARGDQPQRRAGRQPHRQGAPVRPGDLSPRRVAPGRRRRAAARGPRRPAPAGAPADPAVPPPGPHRAVLVGPGLPAARPVHDRGPHPHAGDPALAARRHQHRVHGAVDGVGARAPALRHPGAGGHAGHPEAGVRRRRCPAGRARRRGPQLDRRPGRRPACPARCRGRTDARPGGRCLPELVPGGLLRRAGRRRPRTARRTHRRAAVAPVVDAAARLPPATGG